MSLTDLPPPEESLAVIAASYKSITESTEAIRAHTRSLDANLQHFRTSMLRLQACAMALIGISLVGLGGLWWYSATQHAQIAAILRQMTH